MTKQRRPCNGRGAGTTRRREARRRTPIYMAMGVGTLAACVFLGGLVYGAYAALGGTVGEGMMATPSQPALPTQRDSARQRQIRLIALGDSLAHGFGDATGRGFAGDVADAYRSAGYAVVETNTGLDGLTSGGLLDQLREASLRSIIRAANVVMISIGGNDLNQAAGLPSLHVVRIHKAQARFLRSLAAILSDVRRLNPQTTVIVVGLYNPYGYVQGAGTNTATVVQTWDAAEARVVERFPRAVWVPTYDLFQLHAQKLLYLDHFHPNQQGYARIASRIWQDLDPN